MLGIPTKDKGRKKGMAIFVKHEVEKASNKEMKEIKADRIPACQLLPLTAES